MQKLSLIVIVVLVFFPGAKTGVQASESLSGDIHAKQGALGTCLPCHDTSMNLKPDVSHSCLQCHDNIVTISSGGQLNSSVRAMHGHTVQRAISFTSISGNIVEDGTGVAVTRLDYRLPLNGDSQIECVTCHDPHGEREGKMLRIENSQGQLCSVCHDLGTLLLSSVDDSNRLTMSEVHGWTESRCNVCHLSSTPDMAAFPMAAENQSPLCEACHSGTSSIVPHSGPSQSPVALINHPIGFSPLLYDLRRISHNVIRHDNTFYVSGKTGKVPLFGTTMETALVECSTCHDPHGREGIPKLQRQANRKGELCVICHINIES